MLTNFIEFKLSLPTKNIQKNKTGLRTCFNDGTMATEGEGEKEREGKDKERIDCF